MTEDVIEHYGTFNIKWCTYGLIFGDFNDQPSPSNYYSVLNYDYDDGNNITGTTAEDNPPEMKESKM